MLSPFLTLARAFARVRARILFLIQAHCGKTEGKGTGAGKGTGNFFANLTSL